MHKHHCIHSRGQQSRVLSDLSDGGWGVGGSLSEHIQWQGAHYLVSICLPTVTRASQSHSSSGRNADPSSWMPWSPRAGSTFPHLFHGACTGRYDLQELRKAGFSARLSDMHTDKPTLSQSHPPITLTPVAASWQQKHLSGEPSRYQVESPAHF